MKRNTAKEVNNMGNIVCKIKDAEKQLNEIDKALSLIKEARDILHSVYCGTRLVIEEKAPDNADA